MIICIDDYGTEIHRCRYTGDIVSADDANIVGAMIPGVKARYVIAPTTKAKIAHKESFIAFHESEGNCNTCKNLKRTKHSKSTDGFLSSICTLNSVKVQFHPDDPLHMSCYKSRWVEGLQA